MAFPKNLPERLLQSIRTTYRRSTRQAMYALHALVADLAQTLADAWEEYVETYWPLDTAPGWILDLHWGQKYDVQRDGMSDADYRLFIRGAILLLASYGTRDQVLEILLLLLPPAASVEFTELFPKAWSVTITGVPLADQLPVINFLRRNPAVAGVRKTPARGFATAGEQGLAVAADPVVLTYDSISLGGVPIAAGFGSASIVVPTATAGWAHVAEI